MIWCQNNGCFSKIFRIDSSCPGVKNELCCVFQLSKYLQQYKLVEGAGHSSQRFITVCFLYNSMDYNIFRK
ncbi:unnamed protein product [Paramecium sonneborni]|uniref:Uncharacterized protein n=1 Tax=Paramecium sonneborni TaxID=65129 RepID=A0A8S1PKF2_9CILI|nr:unnamed protein product [Paramecium sonneborni]